MKMNRLTLALLSVLSSAAFAGSYSDANQNQPQDNTDTGSHFYVDVGANYYYFDQPSMNLPMSVGPKSSRPYPTTEGQTYNDAAWDFNPTLTLGYQFLTSNETLQKIFGQENAIELRGSYFHSTGTDTGGAYNYVNGWMPGVEDPFLPTSESLQNSSVSFDNSYTDIGVYYTGHKVISNSLINSPYVGIDYSYLKQDADYTATLSEADDPTSPYVLEGYDNLSTYYIGLVFGDKATLLFDEKFGAYGKLGAGLYLAHTELSGSYTPVANVEMVKEELNQAYSTDTTDDQFTFKLNAEIGLNYYFKNNQDLNSAYVTLLVGADYWNDVPYVQNPTGPDQTVNIAYDSSINPYAGLQLHIPF